MQGRPGPAPCDDRPSPAPELHRLRPTSCWTFERGNTLSVRGDEAEQAWRIVTPVLQGWAEGRVRLEEYAPELSNVLAPSPSMQRGLRCPSLPGAPSRAVRRAPCRMAAVVSLALSHGIDRRLQPSQASAQQIGRIKRQPRHPLPEFRNGSSRCRSRSAGGEGPELNGTRGDGGGAGTSKWPGLSVLQQVLPRGPRQRTS